MQVMAEAGETTARYGALKGQQILIEGPEIEEDLSYPFVHGCLPMKCLEKGMHFDPIVLLEKTDANKEIHDEAIKDFFEVIDQRNP